MGKSVYSLVLGDDVVAEIDRLAALEGRSRSSFINEVLAGYASMQTPRMRQRQMVDALAAYTETVFHAAATRGGALTLRTTLRYKYNPTLCYTVEFWPDSEALGQVRVDLRSQSETLLAAMRYFFQLWNRLEENHLALGREYAGTLDEGGRYLRPLRRPLHRLDEEEAGRAVGAYVTAMDQCMKIFLSHLHDAEEAVRRTEAGYRAALKAHKHSAAL